MENINIIKIIKKNDGSKEEINKEKLTIHLFQLMCKIGEPNLSLAEKLSFLIIDKLSANFKNEVLENDFNETVISVFHSENVNNLLKIYDFKEIIDENENENNEQLKNEIFNVFTNQNYSDFIELFLKELNKIDNNKQLNKNITSYINKGYFYPSSSILKNILTNKIFYSSSLLVIKDDLEDIFNKLKIYGLIQKSNVSVSIDFSHLRSKKLFVSSINKNACGPTKISNLYYQGKELFRNNQSINNISTHYINIEHPDFLDFIENINFLNTNIVIGITNKFMQNYIANQNYFNTQKYNNKVYEYEINTQNIFNKILKQYLNYNNLNLIFIDKLQDKCIIKNKNYLPSSQGFQPTFENSGFFTGFIDVSKFIININDIKLFDWNTFKKVIYDGVEFLDNSIDNSSYTNEILQKNIKDYRQIYLSIIGFSKLLEKLGIKYDSQNALILGQNLSEFISYYSKQKSIALAQDKGCFLKYSQSNFNNIDFNFTTQNIQKTLTNNSETNLKKILSNKPKTDWVELKSNLKKYGIRNLTTFSIISSHSFSAINGVNNTVEVPLFKNTIYEINNKQHIINHIENSNVYFDIPFSHLLSMQCFFEMFCDGICNFNTYFLKETIDLDDIKEKIILSYNKVISFTPIFISETDNVIPLTKK